MVLGHLKQEHTNHNASQAAFLIRSDIYKPHFHTGMQLASATQVEAEPFPGLPSAFLFVFPEGLREIQLSLYGHLILIK